MSHQIQLQDDVMDRIREVAQASQVQADILANELLRNGLNGQAGRIVVTVHHVHEFRPNPEFRAKLIKGQRGNYGYELTVADADRSVVLQQIDTFEEEMLRRFGDEEEQRALKVRKEVVDLYGP